MRRRQQRLRRCARPERGPRRCPPPRHHRLAGLQVSRALLPPVNARADSTADTECLRAGASAAASSSATARLTKSIKKLQEQYAAVLGRAPQGRKARDSEWLQAAIAAGSKDDEDDDEEEESEESEEEEEESEEEEEDEEEEEEEEEDEDHDEEEEEEEEEEAEEEEEEEEEEEWEWEEEE